MTFTRLSSCALITSSVMAILVASWGVIAPSLYVHRLNSIGPQELLGQDLVSLFVGIATLGSYALYRRYPVRGRILQAGGLLYIIYTYAFYCFGLITSSLYLIHIAIIFTAASSFILLLTELWQRKDSLSVGQHYPRRSISLLLIMSSALMTAIEVADLIHKTILRTQPLTSFHVFYTFDLAFVFPAMFITGILNYQKKPLGVLAAGVLLTKIITLLPAIVLSDIMTRMATGHFKDASFTSIASVITLLGIICFVGFWRGISTQSISSG